MLPYTPLHHLLLRELKRPVVATSGNLGDEPIVAYETEVWSGWPTSPIASLCTTDRSVGRSMIP